MLEGDEKQLKEGEVTMTIATDDGSITTKPFTASDLEKATAKLNKSSGFKPDADFDAASDKAFSVARVELQSFVERIERLNAEKTEIADHIKEVFAEAKSRGYDVPALKKIISMRKIDPQDLAEQEAVVDIYRTTLGF